jgi:hypothetical protein
MTDRILVRVIACMSALQSLMNPSASKCAKAVFVGLSSNRVEMRLSYTVAAT